jgi:hypothetical protein
VLLLATYTSVQLQASVPHYSSIHSLKTSPK